ncbi:MAG: lysozyme inhibitor LprI family protein [Burkholderiales bacterium]
MHRFLPALILIAALLAPQPALAQDTKPALEACRALAASEQRASGNKPASIELHADRTLGADRTRRKLGSQAVSLVLSGNGIIAPDSGPATAISFVCLLASERRAVYFHWTPRYDAPALEVCARDTDACLDTLLHVAEADLTQAYAVRFQQARDADAKTGKEAAADTFRRSNQAWLAYRDAECTRQGGTPRARKACVIDLTRRRLDDVR